MSRLEEIEAKLAEERESKWARGGWEEKVLDDITWLCARLRAHEAVAKWSAHKLELLVKDMDEVMEKVDSAVDGIIKIVPYWRATAVSVKHALLLGLWRSERTEEEKL